jgi:hypothetical protein
MLANLLLRLSGGMDYLTFLESAFKRLMTVNFVSLLIIGARSLHPYHLPLCRGSESASPSAHC